MKKKKKTPPLFKDIKLCEKAIDEMTPFLEQLYYGDIKPGLLKNSPAYQELTERLTMREKEISALLGKKDSALFTDYLEEGQQDLLDLVSLESFSQGYRLGARLMLSALTDSDLPFPVNT